MTARTPGVSARLVGAATNVTATFSEPVVGADATTVTLRNSATGAAVPAVVSYDEALRRVTLDPSANLALNTRYTANLSPGIQDASGNALPAIGWSFSTGPAPRVTSRTPAAGATNVARGTNVTATFSEPVVGISRTTARLVNLATGRVMNATVSYAAATRRVTINPFGATRTLLPSRTRFRVDLIGGAAAIRDATGDPLTTTRWRFTTR